MRITDERSVWISEQRVCRLIVRRLCGVKKQGR